MSEPKGAELALENVSEGRYRLSGELSFKTAEQALATGRDFPLAQSLCLDVSGLERVDSAGLAVILEWWRLSHLAGGSLSLEGPSEQLKKLIAISELEPVLLG
ncbi:phospholipid transport system transporter-binding protein [Natronospira proteinivora]|uniref:Phospholipid transport system transporter-binding protein n=1 Tax=Natronospira proteinivora TaxID=1807133 RepID=A0ABT1G5A7_9GAMM|nr:STAS domain-containing protein [Natronospira proteinivora]MCP1726476.1 phospholipid transport system transporter-binding protein [Natronospira proteinivora]